MSAALHFGITVSCQQVQGPFDAAGMKSVAQRAEALGFDSIWATDHIAFQNPILEAVVALSTMAGWTERIALGTGVLLLPLRHPSLVAKQIASLDFLSGGRVILGIGVGGEGAKDFDAVEIPRSERGARCNEAIEVLRRLWSEQPASHKGRFFQFEDVRMEPPPVQPGGPPLWVGGRSKAALRRVAERAEGWLAYFVSPDRFRRDWATVTELADAAGRDPARLTPAFTAAIAMDADAAKAQVRLAEHLSKRYGMNFEPERVRSLAVAGTPADCCDRVAEYVDAGATSFVFLLTGPVEAMTEECDRIFEEIARPLRGS